MNILDIIEEILIKLNKNATDVAIKKHGNRHSNTWDELLRALLIGGSIKEASKLLGQTNYSLEQYMRRYISPVFKEVSYKGKWRSTLLRFIGKKRCIGCLSVKDISLFSTDKSRFDLLTPKCKECSSTARHLRYILNKEEHNYNSKTHYVANKSIYIARAAKRRASKLKATPKWADLVAIKEIYQTCPDGYHVDHIIPLQNPLVCGLHCEFNLQHLSAKENLSKGNKFTII
jgi:hypothetical protein